METAEKEFQGSTGPLSDERVTQGLLNIFEKIESHLKEVQGAKIKSDPRSSYGGACALAALIFSDRIFVANLGDCQGVILCPLISD